MSSESLRSLSHYITLIRGTTYKGNLVGAPGPALLGLGAIEPGGGFRETDFKTYGGECPEKLMLFPGDLFAALKGATKDGKMIGSVARVPKSVAVGRLTQDTVKLEFIESHKATRTYIYWLLRTPQYREYCAGRAMGSAVVALSREDFLSYPVPPLTAQRAHIVDLLEEIEHRCRVLRETNVTLEAIAHALFKSWFVDFDPVRARQDERALDGIGGATAALFPDRFEESTLGRLPQGWRVGELGELSVLNPESWTSKKHPECVAYIDLANVKDNQIGAVTNYSFDEAPSRARRVVRHGDTIVGTVRPGNRSFAYIHQPIENLTASTGFAVLRPARAQNTEFVYLAATRESSIEHLAHVADGGAYPAVRPEVVASLACVVPPDEVMAAFHQTTAPIISSVAENEKKAQVLCELRDALLLRLISGQLRLPEAEAFAA
ncbi:restriction endonuclease subunit S [Burkholderia cenocepacia]|uniref:restriction endonuclease subunit S n=1 Tax=Burkholderia cenocepacia TaxID=95486 RepID=UPI002ABD58BA|nr:restriction endonuclease subunit S [Burkholderia cenocepacia]